MKIITTAALVCTALAGCSEEKNVGNTADAAPTPSDVFHAPRWALSLGSSGADNAIGVAVDPSGDVVAVGYFDGTVDFGNEAFTSDAWVGGWISKRAGSDGHDLWTIALGIDGAAIVTPSDVGVAADGSIIVAGTYNGELTLGSQVLHGPPLSDVNQTWDSFIVKYDATGHVVWATSLGATSNATELALAVGADGRSAMVASYLGTIALPNGTVTASPPGNPPVDNQDIVLAVFGSDGQLAWGVATTNSSNEGGPSVAMTDEDDVVLSGGLDQSITLGGIALQPQSDWSSFAARFTVSGTLLWAKELGDAATLRRPGPIGVASNGLLLTATQQPVAPSENDDPGNGMPAIDSFDPNGQTTWSTQAVAGSAITSVVGVLSSGTIVTGGPTFGGRLNFGYGTMTGCMFLAAHDAAGNTLDAVVYGHANDGCQPLKVAAGTGGAFAVVGSVQAAIDFGGGALRYAGGGDALIVMMDTTP